MSVSGGREARVNAIAIHQRGRVARRQLLAAGVLSGAITRMLARGQLVRRHRGVYAVGAAAVASPWTREVEALLALRAGAVLSHGTALALWELCPSSAPAPAPAATRRRPSTSASWVGPRAGEEGMRRGLVSTRELRVLVARGAGTPTARRRITDLLDARTTATFTRSEAEERFLALVRDAGLPEPLVNVRRHGYELDFLWPAARLAVEIDGFAFHGGRAAFERDRRKSTRLQAAGIEVARVSWRQVTDDPVATIVAVAQMLTTRDRPDDRIDGDHGG